jgi:hypothetical protein
MAVIEVVAGVFFPRVATRPNRGRTGESGSGPQVEK